MATSIFESVDVHSDINKAQHHTSEILAEQLVLRRGQAFNVTLKLGSTFISDLNPLILTAVTGKHPEEDRGTMSCFGFPDVVKRSPSAKAVWKAEKEGTSPPLLGQLTLKITPPADAPIGQYHLKAKLKDEEAVLVTCVLLFNPWCPDDWVFLADEEERQEYVMNEQGVIFVGTERYISPKSWDFGQFEDNMVNICLVLLDLNHKNAADPADDVSARCNPIYVSRVVSAMINSEDDRGVLMGKWGEHFWGGVPPTHWNGSHKILKQWYNIGCHPVKYGQCWVFAGVMCSVMRLLGIPCRVITNYQSAHDNNANLIIDQYHADYGVRERPSPDSIWNYHVWVEGWMKRPDLAADGKYDGWQVLDPTPQEKSDGVYCCGPAPVKAIKAGHTDLKYDIPFVFAEVNADCIDWLVKKDGSKINIHSDSSRVGHNISTKSVGSRKRLNITDSYKHREGTDTERNVFDLAVDKNRQRIEREKKQKEEEEAAAAAAAAEAEEESEETPDEENPRENGGTTTPNGDNIVENRNGETPAGENTVENRNGGTSDGDSIVENGNGGTSTGENGAGTGTSTVETSPRDPTFWPLLLRFDEVSRPVNGKDVELMLVVGSDSPLSRTLSLLISVHGMLYTGKPHVNIQTEMAERLLLPGKELTIPVVVPFSDYHRHMVICDSLKVSAIVTDERDPSNVFLAEDDVVLLDPPLDISIIGYPRLFRQAVVEVKFSNPVDEVLKECTVSVVGSGLLREECEFSVPDLAPNRRVRIQIPFVPYRTGVKTLTADFKCANFGDIKSSNSVTVTL